MPFKTLKIFVATLTLVGLSMSSAFAVTLTGTTVVETTFDFDGAGLTPSLLGDTGVTSQGFLAFPITGGDLGAGLIEHENSGVRLTAGMVFVDLENFLIDISDAANAFILADVTTSAGASVMDAAIFSFDLTSVADPFDLMDPSIELLFTAAASGLLNDVFGLGDENALTDVQFGFAATAPSEVPLPAAVWLFAAGAGALGFAKRRSVKG
ncbi:MAG: VPLPA-CTERM sorting domain-containing protein [Pseudomonadota bacterium]